jgi:SAM-dependent methyltransferase
VSGSSAGVDPSNASQAESWDGEGGAYWAEEAAAFDRLLAPYQEPFLDAARISRAARVLDIGCGNGRTTRDAARRAPAGSATGVDLSAAMLEVARRATAAEGLSHVSYVPPDAQIHPFPAGGADVVISRTGSMFFGDPDAAFANLRRALAPDGRLCLLVWQELARNEWMREILGTLAPGSPGPPPDAPGPFSLSDPARVRELLGGAGFADVELLGLTTPMTFGQTVDAAFRFIVGLAGWMTREQDDETRAASYAALRAGLARHLGATGVTYGAATWIVTARAS